MSREPVELDGLDGLGDLLAPSTSKQPAKSKSAAKPKAAAKKPTRKKTAVAKKPKQPAIRAEDTIKQRKQLYMLSYTIDRSELSRLQLAKKWRERGRGSLSYSDFMQACVLYALDALEDDENALHEQLEKIYQLNNIE